MSRKILIMKDLDYGTAATTANAALNPNLLDDGAVGIYGVVGNQATNNANKFALIVDHATTDIAGNYADTLFRANRLQNNTFQVVQGTTLGGLMSAPIPIDGIKSITATAFVIPVAQISHIGYDAHGAGGTTGAVLNTPTIAAGDQAMVKTNLISFQAGREPHNRQNFTNLTALIAAETDYQIMVKLNAGLIARTDIHLSGKITSATAGAAGGAGEDLNAVNGATTMVMESDPSWDVGDFIRIVGSDNSGDTYQCITGTTTTTLVIDRPYQGLTELIDNLQLLDLGTATGEVGLELIADNDNDVYEFAVGAGALEDAVITKSTDPLRGSGSAEHVGRLEEERQVYKGEWDQIISYMPNPGSHLVAGETYDLYFINYETQNKEGSNPMKTENELIVAFPEGASNGGQAEFEDIMGTILNGADGLGGLE